ncbi:ribosome assembly RNA-binding protein YhbY [Marinilactibacillus psychrotolerans]|uniref:Ribosome assembly RNA-binding protein YhbY n=2 Tax=Marinilactibacillus psychrotolerans TaxID=191770 RepID=A0A5R9C4K5_9LACT|nr:ribosome assembly RNA-binding protein YhbY [Marinilactibacillus psychrotolerans]TLQ07699.1 ribosome assembly RNA-binding protein YhbY [Marinilactibacillus psychrotolerans]GEQ33108.1 RNA-binding protein [Marinilactibacillus psychrotolerans]SJN21611.1 RNA binding protein [Marinilactibacillus psychrotolerans 42ea]
MQLTGKQKRYLRAQVNDMSPLFQIGKNGLTPEMVMEFEEALEKRELMKVQLLQNTDVKPEDAKKIIEDNSDINVVQTIGKVIVLFKPSTKEKYQLYSTKLPRSNN